ncbi:MAG: transglutaminase family protein [Synechococcales bacterium]|nr:transglutaminase family protein [Synechococcales bacterium]
MSNRFDAATVPAHLQRTIRPNALYVIRGLTSLGNRLLALDTIRGYLVEIDPATDDTRILNPYQVEEFIDATGLALVDNCLWFAKGHSIFWCQLEDLIPHEFTTLPYPIEGVAVLPETVYISSQKSGHIYIYERQSGRRITRFPSPGVGLENLTMRGNELWVCDATEQTAYCMDRATGDIHFSVLTPFPCPSGITFLPDPQTETEICYVAYAYEEPYIRDDPNAENPHQLTYRDRTFIHPLHFKHHPDRHYTLSNGYLVEMSYVEELSPLEELTLNNLEWRIALPAETPRQTVRHVEPVGLPFTEEIQDGQRIAVFRFDTLKPNEGRIFGWKALVEMRGIKYQFTPHDLERVPPLPDEFQARYLIDDDDLAMDTPVIRQAARDAVGTETNILRRMLKIRNYVYDRLSYGIKPHIDTPDIALERGIGSCGEYVGIILALARLNGIACRTVGRYKCPPYPERRGIPLEPDFNHVWVEFYVPDIGWLPMESNVDDVIERGPYPTRFFMGLAWYHAEISRGGTFEKLKADNLPEHIKLGDLAINHIRFTILAELMPPADATPAVQAAPAMALEH